MKQVEYTLEYDFSNVKLPPAAMPCFTPSGPMHGRAILQLFDDGWRVKSAPLPLAQIDPAVIQEASAAAAQAKNFSYLGVQPININHGINKINSTNFGYAKSTFPSVYQSIGVRVDDVYINKSGDVIVVKLDLSEFDLENYASVKDALAKTGRWKIVAECAHEGCI